MSHTPIVNFSIMQLFHLPRLRRAPQRQHQTQQHRHHNHLTQHKSSPASAHTTPIIPSVFSLILSLLLLASCCISLVHSQNSDAEDSEPVGFYGDESQCRGEWRFPPNCESTACDYKATWEYHDEGDEIVFTISTKNRNKWTGIGFSENQAMPETDTILGLVEESGRFFLMDSWLQAYEAPPLDPIQNLYNQTAWREAGITTLRFSRPRLTGDSRDYQFSDTNCPYFIFPVNGGVFNAVNKRIRKHESTPIISDRRTCVRSCRAPSTPPPTLPPTLPALSPSSSPAPSESDEDVKVSNKDAGQTASDSNDITKVYRVELKMYNFLTGKARRTNSEAYQELLGSFEETLYKEVKSQYPSVRRIEVSEVIPRDASADAASNTVITNGNALVIVDFLVTQSKSSPLGEDQDETPALTVAITSAIHDGQIGDYAVDQNYLLVAPKSSGTIASWFNKVFGINYLSRFSEEEQRWILAGAGVGALILLALLQACCMFCGCCRRDGKDRSNRSMSSDFIDEKDQQWKDYHDQYGGGYPGYDMDYSGAGAGYGSRASSLHKPPRNGASSYHHPQQQQQQQDRHHPNFQYDEYSAHRGHAGGYGGGYGGGGGHTLERRAYEQQHSGRGGRDDGSGSRRHAAPAANSGAYSVQPDFYFMPHQRKYSSEQQRSMYVDYEGH